MYNYIKGTITDINAKFITIECNNIGYIIYTPNPLSYKTGLETTIYTYLHVREDVFDLYGFNKIKERDFFFKLISVKGIGPKGALTIMASGDLDSLINAIESGNTKYLKKFPGIGEKASQQIILDLHGKLNFEDNKENKLDPKVSQVIEVLKNFGYKNNEIKKIIPILENNLQLSASDLVKLGLKNLY